MSNEMICEILTRLTKEMKSAECSSRDHAVSFMLTGKDEDRLGYHRCSARTMGISRSIEIIEDIIK